MSFLAHLLVIALLLFTIDHDFASAVDRGALISPKRGGGGGGGGGVQFVSLPPAQKSAPVQQQVTKPVPEPTPLPIVTKTPETIPPPVETKPVETAAAASAAPTSGDGGPGTGGGTGGGNGPGNGPGNGAGSGPGEGGGEGLGTRAKQRFLVPILETPPKDLKDQVVNFTFSIGPDGKVQKVELHPEISDKGFREKVLRALRDWQFTPAHDGHGVAVPDTLTTQYRF